MANLTIGKVFTEKEVPAKEQEAQKEQPVKRTRKPKE